MGFWNKLFGKKGEEQKTGGMEDFMTLIRVYFQAVMASDLGITNMAALPDLRVFKATLHVPTQNNKLGLAEKARCNFFFLFLLSPSFFFLNGLIFPHTFCTLALIVGLYVAIITMISTIAYVSIL